MSIGCENIIGKKNKVMQSSKGVDKFVRIIKLKIKLEARNLDNLYHFLT